MIVPAVSVQGEGAERSAWELVSPEPEAANSI